MKFITPVVILSVATSVYSIPLLIARQESNPIQNNLNSNVDSAISPECLKEMEPYNECNFVVDKENYEQSCAEQCIEFFKDPFKHIPSCKGNPALETIFSPSLVQDSYNNVLLQCAKDENGNKCPFSQKLLDETVELGDLYELTCVSKACTDITYEHYAYNLAHVDSNILYITESERQKVKDNLNETLARLKSDSCVAKHQQLTNDASNASTSDASTVKVGTTLIVTLSLLLLLYL